MREPVTYKEIPDALVTFTILLSQSLPMSEMSALHLLTSPFDNTVTARQCATELAGGGVWKAANKDTGALNRSGLGEMSPISEYCHSHLEGVRGGTGLDTLELSHRVYELLVYECGAFELV